MKKGKTYSSILILVSCLFLLTTNGKAQDYEPLFGSEQTSWVFLAFHGVLEYNYQDSISVTEIISHPNYDEVRLHLYSKLIEDGDIFQPNAPYIFEDTIEMHLFENNTLYLMTNELQFGGYDSLLIYSDTLSFGDSITFSDGAKSMIDSVYMHNSKKHFRVEDIHNPANSFPLILIEGVISNFGPLWTGKSTPNAYIFGNHLLCQHKNDTLNYMSDHPIYGGSCNYNPLGLEDEQAGDKLRLYPNPSSGNSLIISGLDNTIAELKIYDVSGKLIETHKNISSELDVSALKSGLYFLNFEFQSHYTEVKKLVRY